MLKLVKTNSTEIQQPGLALSGAPESNPLQNNTMTKQKTRFHQPCPDLHSWLANHVKGKRF